MNRYRIALDAMGGDNAPEAAVAGAIRALRMFADIDILLAGPEDRLEALLRDAEDVRERVELLPATEVIEMDESPMLAVRRKKNASMVVAMDAVRDQRAGAVVTAGSTGAVLACGMFRIGRIEGVERPSLAPVIPGLKKPFLLIDAGANVDCQPKYLLQFGLMGSVYMQQVMGVSTPKVGLVNIGTEAEKGNHLTKETYVLMEKQSSYRFAGNLEARDVPLGDCDVAVADGFDGNVILKYTEGLAKVLFKMINDEMLNHSEETRQGAKMVMPALKAVLNKLDYNQVGGAPLLGVNGCVIKGHGSSGEEAIASAISQARSMLIGDVVGKIREGLSGLNIETENQE